MGKLNKWMYSFLQNVFIGLLRVGGKVLLRLQGPGLEAREIVCHMGVVGLQIDKHYI